MRPSTTPAISGLTVFRLMFGGIFPFSNVRMTLLIEQTPEPGSAKNKILLKIAL
jgi:hypothetical protein